MRIFEYNKLLKKYNSMELKYGVLKEQVKDDCFNKLLKTVGEPDEIIRLRKENAKLRKKIKEYKAMIK